MPRDASASLPDPDADRLVDRSFPRAHRLLTPADFRTAFRAGRRVHSRQWTIVIHARGDQAPARLGLAISKKCDKRAVVRNRIKRAAREWFRHARLTGMDIVIVGKREVATLSSLQMQQSLRSQQRRFASAR